MSAHQFDVCPNPDPASSGAHPYFVVLQANVLRHLNTRVVAPLIPDKTFHLFDRLVPDVIVNGKRYVLDVTNLGVIPTKALEAPIANCESDGDRIKAALDMVFFGI